MAENKEPSTGGLTAGRERGSKQDQTDDVAARSGRGEEVPRRYEENVDDDVMPSDDSSLNTKI